MSVIVISFVTLDGIVTDPAGSEGTAHGGWMFRFGREAIDGDKFEIGRILDGGVLLFGRGTWQQFSQLWPKREGEFAGRMNAAAKLVATYTPGVDVAAWANSSVLDGDLIEAVKNEPRDVVVMGSLSIARQLADADLVDEYRLVTVPTVIGTGERLFAAGAPYAEFECVAGGEVGPFAYSRYRRVGR
jgi:dihydrofolate reductase